MNLIQLSTTTDRIINDIRVEVEAKYPAVPHNEQHLRIALIDMEVSIELRKKIANVDHAFRVHLWQVYLTGSFTNILIEKKDAFGEVVDQVSRYTADDAGFLDYFNDVIDSTPDGMNDTYRSILFRVLTVLLPAIQNNMVSGATEADILAMGESMLGKLIPHACQHLADARRGDIAALAKLSEKLGEAMTLSTRDAAAHWNGKSGDPTKLSGLHFTIGDTPFILITPRDETELAAAMMSLKSRFDIVETGRANALDMLYSGEPDDDAIDSE